MAWYVLYTKSRQEKKVEEQLLELGLDVYCPKLKKVKQWSDRKKIVEEPLFRSYVFINIEEKERHLAFKAFGVVKYLYWLERPAIVKDKEIEAIRNLLGEFEYSEIEVEQFEREDRILIKSGPLTDKEGIVKKVDDNSIEVLIEALQMKVRVDLRSNKVSKLTSG
ncbi:transcription termination/antitermination protein NusG [Jiulongibacter sp. NS-SX5]|uniref:transcription termination/antitermination protein NusG n=1 Tax=Jiulongibacter sp. NS-SX5 TaxID=3463854 RepID=UPI0040586E45